MDKNNDLIRVYSGTEITAKLLQVELEQDGIPSMVKNLFKSGMSAGLIDVNPPSVDLYVKEIDLKKAEPIIKSFIEINEK